MSATDASLLLSAGLAAAWAVDARSAKEGRSRLASLLSPGSVGGFVSEVLWTAVSLLRDANQVLPAALLLFAATSPEQLLARAISVDLDDGYRLGVPPRWITTSPEPSAQQRWAVLLALAIWRAEKMESLVQRVQRSAGEARQRGLPGCCRLVFTDPMGYAWPAVWGSTRRMALIVVSGCGCVPFLRTTFPTVVLDEFLWYIRSKASDLWSRKVCGLPLFVDLLVLPAVDIVHLVLMLVKVFLLGLLAYPAYAVPDSSVGGLLMLCTMAWTAHNCHVVYTTVCLDMYESARALWAARGGGG